MPPDKPSVGPASGKTTLAACLALFALNAFLCWPLFWIEYLDDLHSIEGTFITFAKFLLDYWPHVAWFPWFNAGMPQEASYLPLTHALTALVALVAHCSPAHAFHFLAALTYSLAPVFLFLFGARLSGRVGGSFAAALLWSLFSPSVMFPAILADTGSVWSLRRLQNIVFYGEIPHNVSLCLAPLALLALTRFLETGTARRFVVAVVACAAVMLGNAFGVVLIGASAVMLFAARDGQVWKRAVGIGAVLGTAYLLICRLMPPWLLRLIRANSQVAGGDYRFTWKTEAEGAAFVLLLVALWAVTRRRCGPLLRFSVLFLVGFGGIPVLSELGLGFLPQPSRYQLELELGVCLFAGLMLEAVARRLPRKAVTAAGALCAVFLVFVTAQDYRYARGLIRPLDASTAIYFHQARWIGAHLPGQRIMVSGSAGYWFNLFAENPQLSAGHEPSAPNWMQRVAVFTIYSGQNAGDQDGPISVLWLKAYGCGAVTVPGPKSTDMYHPVANIHKFDGLLPLVWREGDDSVYQVPLKSTVLAHVIPAAAVVEREPIHGLDLAAVRPYVAALEDPALPDAQLTWDNPERGRLRATLGPRQVVSLQFTYDPGWRATVAGRPARIRKDGLGMMVIEPDCSGACAIDLEFTGGAERRVCLAISVATGILLLWLLFGPRWHMLQFV